MKKKRSNQIVVGLFSLFLCASFTTQFVPDIRFSDQENRYLATFPKLSLKSIMDGEFTSKLELYIQDHVMFRNQWIMMKTELEKGMGKKETNGLYFGEHGWLYEVEKRPEETLFQKNISYLNDLTSYLSQENISSAFLPIYSSYMFYLDQLPSHNENYDQREGVELIENNTSALSFVDSYKLLLADKGEDIYFKSDHHWTQRGAYDAYVALGEYYGYQAIPLSELTANTSSQPFYGTLFSKAPLFASKGDSFSWYEHPTIKPTMSIPESDIEKKSLYASEYLTQKDQYKFFLGGNQGEVIIESEVKNDRTLLLFKDSYSHALVPLLANHFEKIVLLDLRYFSKPMKPYIDALQPSEVLFAYNISWFARDASFINSTRS